MSEIIRETRNAINARLDMLESLMKLSNKSGNLNEFTQRLERIESMLSYNDNIKARFPNVEVEEQIPQVIIMEKQYSYEDSTNTNSPIHYNSPVQENTSMPNDASSLHALDNDSDKEEALEEEEEEVVEEEVVEEEVVEEEEVGIELESFEYKGLTLYRDSDNKVYQMDDEGSISEPIGLWDDAKQRITKVK